MEIQLLNESQQIIKKWRHPNSLTLPILKKNTFQFLFSCYAFKFVCLFVWFSFVGNVKIWLYAEYCNIIVKIGFYVAQLIFIYTAVRSPVLSQGTFVKTAYKNITPFKKSQADRFCNFILQQRKILPLSSLYLQPVELQDFMFCVE